MMSHFTRKVNGRDLAVTELTELQQTVAPLATAVRYGNSLP